MGVLAALGAVAEEFVFRGLIFDRLIHLVPASASVVISALLFSSYHVSMFQLVPTFLWGVGFALLRFRSKNLWLGIIAHIVVNIAGLLLFIFGLVPK